jgi:hypothetical protein
MFLKLRRPLSGSGTAPAVRRTKLVPTILIVLVVLAALGPVEASAAPLTGYSVQLEAQGGGVAPIASFSVFDASTIPFSNSQSSFGSGSGQASTSISYGGGNVGLHATASATSAGGAGQSIGEVDTYYHDTFQIAGSGPQIFAWTLNLRGSASATYPGFIGPNDNFSLAQASLALYENSSYATWGTVLPNADCFDGVVTPDGNFCGNMSGDAILDAASSNAPISGTIRLQGTTSVELGLFLIGRTESYAAFGTTTSVSSTLDLANTGWFTLTPLTPGAAFTTASGLSYSGDPDTVAVPEPTSMILFASAFAVILASRRRHCRFEIL